MDKSKIDVEVRLQAIEYVLIHVSKIALLTVAQYDETAANDATRNLRRAARESLTAETLPGVDPAIADHVMAEVRDAVDKLLEGVEKVVAGTYP